MIDVEHHIWLQMVEWLDRWYVPSECNRRGCYLRVYFDADAPNWYVQHGANPESRFLIPPDQALTVTERDLTAWTIAVHAYTDNGG